MAFDPLMFTVGPDDPLLSARGVRNNNPGNMRGQYFGADGTDGLFATYPDAATGIGAIGHQLSRYYTGATTGKPLTTARQIISTWAPSKENNTDAYVDDVAGGMGVGPDDQLNLRDPDVMTALASGIIKHENGGNPYSPAFVKASLTQATPSFTGAGMDTSYNVSPLDGSGFQFIPDQGDGRGAFYFNDQTGMTIPAGQGDRAGVPGAYADKLSKDADGKPEIDPSTYPPMGTARNNSGFSLAGPQDTPDQPYPSGADPAGATGPLSPPGQSSPSQPPNMAGGLPSGDISQDPVYGPLYNKSFWAGMFGNKGLIGGALAGQAGVMNERIQNAAMMQRYGMLTMTPLARMVQAGVPENQARRVLGLPADPSSDADYSSKPMSPATSGAADKQLQGIMSVRLMRSTLSQIQDDVKSGNLKLDPMHQAWYKAQALAGNPLGDKGVIAYQRYVAAQKMLQNETLRGNVGVQTDRDAKDAADLISGGGITSNDQYLTHSNYLMNSAALAEQNMRARVDQMYKNAKQPPFDWNGFEQTLAAGAPGQGSAKSIGTNPYQPNNVGQPHGPIGTVGDNTGVGMKPGETRNYGGIQVRRIQ